MARSVEERRQLMGQSARKPDFGAVFDQHVRHEFEDKDVEASMATMIAEPYVWNVPTARGGIGGAGVRRFYSEEFVGKMPADTRVIPVSRTIGENQLVEELILAFTHDVEIPYLLPGIPPTGQWVEIPHVVVMGFDEEGKVTHEHIYWDQASLLAQVGLLDTATLPVVGREQAAKLEEARASRAGAAPSA
jgi:carboxymethylenebutenolidase